MSLNHASKYAELMDAHFAVIGKVVVEWSNVEFLLRTMLARLLFTAEFLARSYTDRLTAAKVQEAIDEAVEIQRSRYGGNLISDSILDEIVAVNKKITLLRSTRNRFAHFCWCRSTDDEIFGTRLSGGVPNPKRERSDSVVLSVTELEAFYHDAYSIVDSLEKLLSKLPELKEESLNQKLTYPPHAPERQ